MTSIKAIYTQSEEQLKSHYIRAWKWYKDIQKEAKILCAPMVGHSEGAFREFVYKHGIELCYTPMYNSSTQFNKTPSYLGDQCDHKKKINKPIIAQICGSDIEKMVYASKQQEEYVDGIDINLGCPQNIAKRGNYGAYLQQEPEKIYKLIRILHDKITKPISVKIRLLEDDDEIFTKTIYFCQQVQDCGACAITIHGRTRKQTKENIGPCDISTISRIKDLLNIPVFANGGISTPQDAYNILKTTKVDAVMIAEALLTYPTMFSPSFLSIDIYSCLSIVGSNAYIMDPLLVSFEFIQISYSYANSHIYLRPHLFKILFRELNYHTDIREELGKARTIQQMETLIISLRKLQLQFLNCFIDDTNIVKLEPLKPEQYSKLSVIYSGISWYNRYRYRCNDTISSTSNLLKDKNQLYQEVNKLIN